MADQQRWFKLWYSAGSDDAIISLPPDLRWAWAMLGSHTKIHGTNGTVEISEKNAALAGMMGVTVECLKSVIKSLPHIHVEEGQNRNGTFTVTWLHWQKYQEDSTVANRQKRWRERNRNGLRGEEKRREENKKKNISPIVPKGDDRFLEFWTLYPNKKAKTKAAQIWARMKLGNGEFENVMTGLKKQISSEQWSRDGGKFIPHPSTWLNQKRWEDQMEVEVKEISTYDKILAAVKS